LITDGRIHQLKDERQAAGLVASSEILAVDYLRACRIRTVIREDFRKLFDSADVLLSPACFQTAPPIEDPLDRQPAGDAARPTGGLRHLGPAGNLAGLPAISIPCGFADGLPVAFTLVSRPLTENTILAVGMEYQKQTGWYRKRPVL
jgi:aspartyl-tRNA(Asn)/glutamyl-tRNA(Gln) amidotransferase subunit A